MTRRSKIICTLGPSSCEDKEIASLIKAGMDVARLNFSHGTHDFYKSLINKVRSIAKDLKSPVAIMQDLQGPKIRIGKVKENTLLTTNSVFKIVGGHELGDHAKVSLDYENAFEEITVGANILLDDGKIVLQVQEIVNKEIITLVKKGGLLKSNKGAFVPGLGEHLPILTDKDLRDINFGAQASVDSVALSFVRKSEDLKILREALAVTKTRPLIFSKIERKEAINNLDDIVQNSDGVMVARGDLGLEMSPEEVPLLQKKIIERTIFFGKTVAVATEMLESMIDQIRPTRAEASDVANAVLDGAGLLTLSAETASGKHPTHVVSMMSRLIEKVEDSSLAEYWRFAEKRPSLHDENDIQNAMAMSAVHACESVGAKAIALFSNSGAIARMVSAYRPQKPIIAFVPNSQIEHKLCFYWGVKSIIMPMPKRTSELLAIMNKSLLSFDFLHPLDRVVVLTKIPIQKEVRTNTVHIHTIKAH